MKKQKIEFAEQHALDTCIRQLEGLLESLKSGTLSLNQGGKKLWMRPGGAVDIELRAEQSGDRESLEIALAWRRASLHVVSRRNEDAPPKTVRNWQRPSHVREAALRDELPPPSQRPLFGKLDSTSAARYQEIYAAARSTNGEGQHRLDESRFVRALADLGIDQQLQQELYNLALQAEADGRASLFKAETIAALRKAS
ncbi:MAG TPA: amphi-Trp domain-containing protein [Polyangiaceae bacterium]|nr:amphi-Trp domain-containing protein [Polyangiaceae bacterium]